MGIFEQGQPICCTQGCFERTCSDLTQPCQAFLPFLPKKGFPTYESKFFVVICPHRRFFLKNVLRFEKEYVFFD